MAAGKIENPKGIRRGALVTVVVAREYGKPRPALVVQADLFAELDSLVVCPLTSLIRNDADLFRLTVDPTKENGLVQASQISIDKITTIPRGKIGKLIGYVDEAVMHRVNRALAVFQGIV